MDIEEILNKYYDAINNDEQILLFMIKEFKKKGGDINIPLKHGEYLIHLAAEAELLTVIKWLVKNGADIEAKDIHGNTPLLVAVDSDIDGAIQNNLKLSFASTQLLLELGADIHARNFDNETIVDIVDAYGGRDVKKAFSELELKV